MMKGIPVNTFADRVKKNAEIYLIKWLRQIK